LISTEKPWLAAVPWPKVAEMNAAFCQAQSLPAEVHEHPCAAAKARWEDTATRALSLREALELCRRTSQQTPFVFNNANTFAAVAKLLVEDWAKGLPPVEATILNTTVSHYVAERITQKELLQVLRHLEPHLIPAAKAAKVPALPAKPFPQPGAV
jgi:hypothetical protein